MKNFLIVCLIFSGLYTITAQAVETEEVYIALATLADSTKNAGQVSSYVSHFCLVTQKSIKENKRGWYSIAKDEYIQLKMDLNSDDLSKFKNAFLAFESVFYKYNGN